MTEEKEKMLNMIIPMMANVFSLSDDAFEIVKEYGKEKPFSMHERSYSSVGVIQMEVDGAIKVGDYVKIKDGKTLKKAKSNEKTIIGQALEDNTKGKKEIYCFISKEYNND